jgi:sortase A
MRGRVRQIAAVALLTAGLVIFLDVGVTLAWGEPVSTLRGWLAQREAAAELEDLEERYNPPASIGEAGEVDRGGLRRLADRLAREVRAGEAIGRLEIAAIDLNIVVVEGTGTAALQRGPGRYPETVFPGQRGTVGIAGHRTTFLAPFRHIDELGRGDEVVIEMPYATFTYRFEAQRIVDPSRVNVVRDVGRDRLVLTACHPLYSAAQRIVVFALLVDVEPSGAGGAGPQPAGSGEGRPNGEPQEEIAPPGLEPTLAAAGGLIVIAALMLAPGFKRRGPGSARRN